MTKNKNFVKRNVCPYCTYPCDSATGLDGAEKPDVGSISFCIMCCQPSEWNDEMKLIKFDLNSITDLIERTRMKILCLRIEQFWGKNPSEGENKRREKYLKIYELNV